MVEFENSPPGRTVVQRMEALERANEIRSKRSRLKRDVAAGRQSALPVIAAPPEWTATMKVYDLLLAMPKVGRVKATKHLAAAQMAPSKTLGGVSERQRGALLAVLGGRSR